LKNLISKGSTGIIENKEKSGVEIIYDLLKEDFANQIYVYIVIHSLDACNMKEPGFMDVISELATIE